MSGNFEATGYSEESGIYFWTEVNQEGPHIYRGVLNIAMQNDAGTGLTPDLKVLLPGTAPRADSAQAAAHDFGIIIAKSGVAKTMIESWRSSSAANAIIRTTAPCDACKGIVQDKRGAKGHDALEQVGSRPGASPIGQARVEIRSYKCRVCGTNWEYQDDRGDSFVGWSMV